MKPTFLFEPLTFVPQSTICEGFAALVCMPDPLGMSAVRSVREGRCIDCGAPLLVAFGDASMPGAWCVVVCSVGRPSRGRIMLLARVATELYMATTGGARDE